MTLQEIKELPYPEFIALRDARIERLKKENEEIENQRKQSESNRIRSDILRK